MRTLVSLAGSLLLALSLIFGLLPLLTARAEEAFVWTPLASAQFKPVSEPALTKVVIDRAYEPSPPARKGSSNVARPSLMTKPMARPPVLHTHTAHRLSGIATWYCNFDTSRGVWSRCMAIHPDRSRVADLYAAAGPALRAALGPSWRGRRVTVHSGVRSVTVVLSDWCACGGGHTIDLYRDAWDVLFPVRVPITITW